MFANDANFVAVSTTQSSTLAYRPDIDGLRALAVVLVVMFHTFPRLLPGGFSGVDVFFVISGYLISGVVVSALRENRFSFGGFYAARVRRILPGLVLVVACSLIFGWRVLWPDEYALLGYHAFSAMASVGNFAMMREQGYFSPSAAHQPLLHLWSLGVEEQFYLLWPALLVYAWKRKDALARTTIVCGALSFAAYVGFALAHKQLSVFYNPIARGWEILVGAWLASRVVAASDVSSKLTVAKNAASLIGFAAVGASAIAAPSVFGAMGARTVLAVLGAALIIGAGRETWVSRNILAHPVSIWIGLISYPIYLWHWPILTFARILHGGPLAVWTRVAIIPASVGAAALTYMLLDKPIRFGIRTRFRIVLVALSAACVGVAGLVVRLDAGFPSRAAPFDAFHDLASNDSPLTAPSCPAELQLATSRCALWNNREVPTIALIGDSHARRIFLGLAPALAKRGENLLVLSCGGCVPLYDVLRSDQANDTGAVLTRRSFEYVFARPSIHTVLVAGRGPFYLDGGENGLDDAFETDRFTIRNAGRPDITDPGVVFANGMRETFQRLRAAGKRIVFVRAGPELSFNPRACFARWPRERVAPCEESVAEYSVRSGAYVRLVSAVAREFPDVTMFDQASYLCDGNSCPAFAAGHFVYFDNNHLSLWGSRLLAEPLALSTLGAPRRP